RLAPVLMVLMAGCGGGSDSTKSAAAATSTAASATTPAPTGAAQTTTAAARRLTQCPDGEPPRAFARIAPTGQTLPSFPTADAAVADFVNEMSAKSSQLIGPDPKGMRYSVVGQDGDITEVIVAQQPQGWAVTVTIAC